MDTTASNSHNQKEQSCTAIKWRFQSPSQSDVTKLFNGATRAINLSRTEMFHLGCSLHFSIYGMTQLYLQKCYREIF